MPDHSRPAPEPPAASSLPVPRPATSAASAASWNSQENSSAGHAFGQHYLSLVESDKARHRKLGITATAGLLGATYPNGIYYVQLGIGTPPQTFNLDIDTGSNLLWLNCLPCNPCTLSKTLQTNPPFDSAKSSSVKLLQCSNKACINPDRTVKIRNCNVTSKPLAKGSAAGSAGGSDEDLGCMYSVAYGDGSGTSGRLLGDVIHLPISGSARAFKVPITFGCGNSQQGNFYNGLGWTYYQALDGLIGLGRGSLSLLTAVGAYKEFFPIRQVVAHCLGGDSGGGWMTVGDIPIPPLTAFTPLRPDDTFYKVTLRRVFVGGIEVAVNPAQYGNLTHGNAIFDSGTTYSIMPPLFVPPLFHLIQTAVGLPRYAFSIGKEGSLCFSSTDELTAEGVSNCFPLIKEIVSHQPAVNRHAQFSHSLEYHPLAPTAPYRPSPLHSLLVHPLPSRLTAEDVRNRVPHINLQ
ncbi:unnamed protein product [Closterium sp. Naga37s-1]|nr:unnamed protein product [Closterium sp. Naga37s-1]